LLNEDRIRGVKVNWFTTLSRILTEAGQ